jgi:hypothetical protein
VATTPGNSWKLLELFSLLENTPGNYKNPGKLLENSWNFVISNEIKK